MTSLHNTAAELRDAWQVVQQRWEQTKAVWNDPVAWSFEQERWAPLEQQTRAVRQEMERLAQVVAQAQRNVK